MHEENVPYQAGESLNPVKESESNLIDFKLADDAHSEAATPKDTMPEDALPEDAMSEHAMSEDAMSEDAMSEDAMPEDAMPEDAMSEDAMSEDALPEDAMPEDAMPEDAMPEDALPEDAMSEDAMSEDATSEDGTHEEAMPEDAMSEDAPPEDATSEDGTPEEAMPEEAMPEGATSEGATSEDATSEDATPEGATSKETTAGSVKLEKITSDAGVKQLTRTEERIRKVTESGEIKLRKFRRFSDIAINGIRAFVEIGLALKEIRVHDLFKEDGHKSWTAYCPQVLSISKSYADRIILSAQIATHLEKQNVEGIAPELMIPRAESQVRPIGKVPKEFWVVVWCQAIGIAGGIPTQKEVVFVVDQMFGPTGKTSPKNPSLKDIVKDVVVRLRLVLEEGCSKKELEDLVIELEEAVKVRLKVANPKSIT